MSPKKRRFVLLVSMITLTVITLALLPSDMLIAARFNDAINTTNGQQSDAVTDYDAPAKNDPHIGDPFPQKRRSGGSQETNSSLKARLSGRWARRLRRLRSVQFAAMGNTGERRARSTGRFYACERKRRIQI